MSVYSNNSLQRASAQLAKEHTLELSDHVLAGTRIGEGTLAFARNILCMTPVVGPEHPVVGHLGYYAGGLATVLSGVALKGAVQDYRTAKTLSDREGLSLSKWRIGASSAGIGASLAYLAGKVWHAAASAFGLLCAADALVGFGSMIGIGLSGAAILRCARFYGQLHVTTEKEGLRKTLQSLKDAVIANDSDEAQRKLYALKRRTSYRSVQLIVRHIDRLIQEIDHPHVRLQAMELISAVKKDTTVKLALYAISLFAGMIGFAAAVIAGFFSLGIVPIVLGGIAAGIHLSVTAYHTVWTAGYKEIDPKWPGHRYFAYELSKRKRNHNRHVTWNSSAA